MAAGAGGARSCELDCNERVRPSVSFATDHRPLSVQRSAAVPLVASLPCPSSKVAVTRITILPPRRFARRTSRRSLRSTRSGHPGGSRLAETEGARTDLDRAPPVRSSRNHDCRSGLPHPDPQRSEPAARPRDPGGTHAQTRSLDRAIDRERPLRRRGVDVPGRVPCSNREGVTALCQARQGHGRFARPVGAGVDRALETGRSRRAREGERGGRRIRRAARSGDDRGSRRDAIGGDPELTRPVEVGSEGAAGPGDRHLLRAVGVHLDRPRMLLRGLPGIELAARNLLLGIARRPRSAPEAARWHPSRRLPRDRPNRSRTSP